MSERIQHIGRRAELREERLRVATEAASLRDQLRTKLDPVEDVDKLAGAEIATLAFALNGKLERLAEINAKLAKLAELLGG